MHLVDTPQTVGLMRNLTYDEMSYHASYASILSYNRFEMNMIPYWRGKRKMRQRKWIEILFRRIILRRSHGELILGGRVGFLCSNNATFAIHHTIIIFRKKKKKWNMDIDGLKGCLIGIKRMRTLRWNYWEFLLIYLRFNHKRLSLHSISNKSNQYK